ncbi:PadR family transcriptional regulator [Haloarcula litorea]|uniref:PadR family transcriptional regulator n=1 Tax=Haloarcula litorea TaxID=3032579 RepID=UPI0023E7DA75|nr:helix-turn-helix transcriptional regulator [Halomicroarcula sp. GDY20]
MSGDDLRRVATGEAVGDRPDERLTPLDGTDDRRVAASRDAVPESVLASIADDVADGDVAVDDGLVTGSLDEVLLALIALSDDETHGTGLMTELSNLFDADLSPGTVYPRLHELEADDTLAVHELVQTKQYAIDDPDTARASIEDAARSHLALGLFLHASLDAV